MIDAVISDTTTLEAELEESQKIMEQLAATIQSAITENARIAQDQETYRKRFDELTGRYETEKQRHNLIAQSIAEKTSAHSARKQFIQTLNVQSHLITEFDPTVWGILLDHMTIYQKDDIRFTFEDGTEIRA